MGAKSIIIDVREPEEFAASHVSGAINIPLGQIQSGNVNLEGANKSDTIVVYCSSGNRSSQAKAILEGRGYTNVQNGINQQNVEHNLQ